MTKREDELILNQLWARCQLGVLERSGQKLCVQVPRSESDMLDQVLAHGCKGASQKLTPALD